MSSCRGTTYFITIVFALVTGVAGAFSQAKPGMRTSSQVSRGKFLVLIGGCNDCHSPKVFTQMGPVPDTTRLLSGHRAEAPVPNLPDGVIGTTPDKWGAVATGEFTGWRGPWGTSFAANLTPDKETGIGSWTPDMFIKALRTGKHMGSGRDILPPMPWYDLGHLPDPDLKAIFSYLQSLKPVSNAVPDPIPPPAPPKQ